MRFFEKKTEKKSVVLRFKIIKFFLWARSEKFCKAGWGQTTDLSIEEKSSTMEAVIGHRLTFV